MNKGFAIVYLIDPQAKSKIKNVAEIQSETDRPFARSAFGFNAPSLRDPQGDRGCITRRRTGHCIDYIGIKSQSFTKHSIVQHIIGMYIF